MFLKLQNFLGKRWIQLDLICAEKLYNFLFVDAP